MPWPLQADSAADGSRPQTHKLHPADCKALLYCLPPGSVSKALPCTCPTCNTISFCLRCSCLVSLLSALFMPSVSVSRMQIWVTHHACVSLLYNILIHSLPVHALCPIKLRSLLANYFLLLLCISSCTPVYAMQYGDVKANVRTGLSAQTKDTK